NLALESLDVHARGKFGSDHLHDDASAKRRVGCKEDTRHPAAAELALEPVRVTEGLLEGVAKRSGHRVSTPKAAEVRPRNEQPPESAGQRGRESNDPCDAETPLTHFSLGGRRSNLAVCSSTGEFTLTG